MRDVQRRQRYHHTRKVRRCVVLSQTIGGSVQLLLFEFPCGHLASPMDSSAAKDMIAASHKAIERVQQAQFELAKLQQYTVIMLEQSRTHITTRDATGATCLPSASPCLRSSMTTVTSLPSARGAECGNQRDCGLVIIR